MCFNIFKKLRKRRKMLFSRRKKHVVPFPDEGRTEASWETQQPMKQSQHLKKVTGMAEDGSPLEYDGIDLKLPEALYALKMSEFEKLWQPASLPEVLDKRTPWSNNQYGIGSDQNTDKIYFQHDSGVFQCILEAWMNHWNLRTCPEDWWFPVACKIAKDIATASLSWEFRQEEDVETSPVKVKRLFLPDTTTTKEKISIEFPVYTIDDVNYNDFFEIIANELSQRVQPSDYVETMQSDFSTSDPTHQIAAQINLMASLKNFFEYELLCAGCGLPGIEMCGSQSDWDRLVDKINGIREVLSPLFEPSDDGEEPILDSEWFDHVEYVFEQLALTKREPENPAVRDFWSGVLLKSQDWAHQMQFYFETGPRTHEVPAFNGWLIKFLTNLDAVKVSDLGSDLLSGVNSVKLNVKTTWCDYSEETDLISGILGFQLIEGSSTFNGKPSLAPFHMWAMLLDSETKLKRRVDLSPMEQT